MLLTVASLSCRKFPDRRSDSITHLPKLPSNGRWHLGLGSRDSTLLVFSIPLSCSMKISYFSLICNSPQQILQLDFVSSICIRVISTFMLQFPRELHFYHRQVRKTAFLTTSDILTVQMLVKRRKIFS